jgi:hypothetical protein
MELSLFSDLKTSGFLLVRGVLMEEPRWFQSSTNDVDEEGNPITGGNCSLRLRDRNGVASTVTLWDDVVNNHPLPDVGETVELCNVLWDVSRSSFKSTPTTSWSRPSSPQTVLRVFRWARSNDTFRVGMVVLDAQCVERTVDTVLSDLPFLDDNIEFVNGESVKTFSTRRSVVKAIKVT